MLKVFDMPKRKRLRKFTPSGFTIIEVLIVLAIAATILAVIFLAVPSLQKNSRDTFRRSYVGDVYAALEEFHNNNGVYPACDTGAGHPCTAKDRANAMRFISTYLPSGSDPSTGKAYNGSPVTTDADKAQSQSNATVYYFNAQAVDHALRPAPGQIIIDSGHWCYSTKSDEGPETNPIAGLDLSTADLKMGKFVILIGTEKGGFYCIDNY